MKPAVEKDTRLRDSFFAAVLGMILLIVLPGVFITCLITKPMIALGMGVVGLFLWMWYDMYHEM